MGTDMSSVAQRVIAVEAILADCVLTSAEKMVMIAIICDAVLDSRGHLGTPSMTTERLAQRAGLSVRSVQRAIGSLEYRRYLRKDRSAGNVPHHFTVLLVKE